MLLEAIHVSEVRPENQHLHYEHYTIRQYCVGETPEILHDSTFLHKINCREVLHLHMRNTTTITNQTMQKGINRSKKLSK